MLFYNLFFFLVSQADSAILEDISAPYEAFLSILSLNPSFLFGFHCDFAN